MTRPLEQKTGESFVRALEGALNGRGPALFAGHGNDNLPAHVAPRVAVVIQSSGSTARPKRVALSADALLAGAAASESALGGPGQWVLALDPSYIAGLNVLVRSLFAATTPVIMAPAGFTADRFLTAVRQLDHQMRFTSLVPAQLAQLLDAPEALDALRRFDRILLGGQAAPRALIVRAAELGLAVSRTYGSTETAGGCVYDGRAIGMTRVRIVDGEVQLSGPTLAEGYLDDPQRTEAAFFTDQGRRWYRTSDAGFLHHDELSITGRLDDVIVSGGVKVSLGELEAVLHSATPLVDAVVIAVDDDRWGQVPVVVSTVSMDLAELRLIAREALGVAAGPAGLVRVDEILSLPSGKPDRVAIRERLHR